MDLDFWPYEIPFNDISKTHPEYNEQLQDLNNLGKLVVHEDLYSGGSAFRARANSYLDMRTLEEGEAANVNLKSAGDPYVHTHKDTFSGQGRVSGLRAKRLKASRYVPVVAGKLEALNAATLQSPPRITAFPKSASGDQNQSSTDALLHTKARTESGYWHSLNSNADGNGTDLSELARELVRSCMVHGRAYLGVRFPDASDDYIPQTAQQQREMQETDARFVALDGKTVDDWLYDCGRLMYVRTHRVEQIKDRPWSESTGLRHTWTYYTDALVVTYVADATGTEKPKAATRIATPSLHALGVIPIIPVTIPKSLWLMERLREPVLKHYNRSSSLTWALNQMGFSVLTLIGTDPDQDVSHTFDPETEALLLKTGSAAFLSPNVAVWSALQGDLDKQEQVMDDTIQAAALSVGSRDSSGRQSGVAKYREFGSLANLLASYGTALRNAFERGLEIIKASRNETQSIHLDGLDKFDVQSLEIKTRQVKELLPLSQSPTFERYATTELLLAAAQNAPDEVRGMIAIEQIGASKQSATTDQVEVNDETVESDNDDLGRQPKTQLVKSTIKERVV